MNTKCSSDGKECLVTKSSNANSVWMNGDIYTILLESKHTAGSISILEAVVPPGGGPPRHNHENEDEIFYVTHGELEISAGDVTYTAAQGSLVFIPRGVMHGFKNKTKDFSKQLLIFTPGGFEGFFYELGLTVEAGLPIPELKHTNQENARFIGAKYKSYQE